MTKSSIQICGKSTNEYMKNDHQKLLKKNNVNSFILKKKDENNDINFIKNSSGYNNIFFYNSNKDNKNKYKINETNNSKNNKHIMRTKLLLNLSDKEKNKQKNEVKNFKAEKIYEKKYEVKSNNIKQLIIDKNGSFKSVNLKLKLPLVNKNETICLELKDLKGDNCSDIIKNIIKKYSLDEDNFEPLLSLINNSIEILENINGLKVKEDKINQNIFNYKDNNSSFDNLNYSIVNDIVERKKYYEYIENIFCINRDEIYYKSKIRNLSI